MMELPMPSHVPPRPGLPVPLVALGTVILALGVGLQARGVVLPEGLAALTGAGTTFGIMARIGGVVCLAGIAMATLAAMLPARAGTGAGTGAAPAAAPVPAEDPRPEAGPERMAEWQRRLAEKAAARAAPPAPDPRRGRFGRSLHKAAIVLVAVALAGIVAGAILGRAGPDPAHAAQAIPESVPPAG